MKRKIIITSIAGMYTLKYYYKEFGIWWGAGEDFTTRKDSVDRIAEAYISSGHIVQYNK